MTYPMFWQVVKDFQTVIGALIGLTAVAGAITGILLKARLDRRATDRTLRDTRRETAASISAIINLENSFPATSIFRVPTEHEVVDMLKNTGNAAVGINSYIGYLTRFVSTLSGFPPPIADRAHFIGWLSARSTLAMGAVHNAPEEQRDSVARNSAAEIRMLLIAGIVALDELRNELSVYAQSPELYEREWHKPLGVRIPGGRVGAPKFDLKKLRVRTWEVSLKPSDGPDNNGTDHNFLRGAPRRSWLDLLLQNINKRVLAGRKETDWPLEALYDRCSKLPEDSEERRTLERLIVAIWKRGTDEIDEDDVWKLDPEALGLVSDLGKQAGRSWRL